MLIKPLIWLMLISMSSWGWGCYLLSHLNGRHEASDHRFFFPYVLGTGCVILLTFVLLLLGLMNVVAVFIMLLPGLYCAVKQWPNHRNTINIYYVLLLAVIISEFLPAFAYVLRPEVAADSLSYHLPYAKFLAQNQSLAVNEFLRYPLNTLNFNLLYVIAYLVDGEILARMFHGMAALAVAIGLVEWGVKTNRALAGVFASFIWLSTVIVTKLLSSAYIDLGLAMFVFAAALPFLLIKKEQDDIDWQISAIFLGLAVGTKYLGLMYVPLFAAWFWVISKNPRYVAYYVLVSLLVGSPWYLYNVWVSGNPVHPFLQNLFGYWLWTAEDLRRQGDDLLIKHGVDRTWLELIKLPYHFAEDKYIKHGGISGLMIWGLVISPLMLLVKTYRWLACFVLINVVLWFFTSQILRYLLPVFPLIAILAAVSILQPLTWLAKKWINTDKQKWFRIINTCLVVLVLMWSLNHAHEKIKKRIVRGQLALTESQWQTMLEKKLDYQIFSEANKHKPRASFKFGFNYANHYADHIIMGDWFGVANMASIARGAKSPETVAKHLRSKGVDLVIIDLSNPLFNRLDAKIKGSEYFQLVFENSKGRLYRLNYIAGIHNEKSAQFAAGFDRRFLYQLSE